MWTKIGEIAEVVTGNTPSKKNPYNYGKFIPFVKPPELSDSSITDAADSLSEEGAKNARIAPQNSILVSCIGNLGKTGINKIPVAFNQQINAVIFPSLIMPKFGFYYCQTSIVKEWLNTVASATTITIINKSKFENMPFPLAPFNEQARIVARLEELFTRLDAGIEGLRKIKVQLKRYRQTVLKYAFEGKLTEEWHKTHKDQIEPAQQLKEEYQKKSWEKFERVFQQDASDMSKLPTDWIWIGLSVVCDKIQDGSHFSPKIQYRTGGSGKYLYITAKNLKESGMDLSDVTYVDYSYHKSIYRRCNPEKGDVLLIKDGVKTGIAVVNNLEEEFSLLSSVALFKPKKSVINPYYLKYFLNSPVGFSLTTGKMTGTAIKRIILDKIRKSFIPLAPFVEQHKIVEEIERRLSIADETEKATEQSLRQAELLRQIILKAAYEGKLVPQDPSDEPADKLLQRIRGEKAKSKDEKDTNRRKKIKPKQLELSTYVK
jgi:type I restriction enzyme S subunit